jgi:WD40 repeat protein
MVIVSDAATGEAIHRLFGHRNSISALALSHDSRLVASGSRMNGQVVLWDALQGKKIKEFPPESTVHWMAFSPDDRLLAVVSERVIRIWDVAIGREYDSIEAQNVFWVAFGPDGSTMAVAENRGREDSSIKLMDIATRTEIRSFELPSMRSATLAGDGHTLAAGSSNGSVRVWNAESGAMLAEFPPVGFGSRWNASMVFSPNSQLVASVGDSDDSRLVRILNVKTGKQVVECQGHRAGALSVAFSCDDKMVASGGWRGRILFWDTQTGKEIVRVISHFGDVRSVAFVSGSKQVITKSQDGTIRLWDATTGSQEALIKSYWRWGISADGRLMASVGMRNVIKITNLQSNELLYTLEGHEQFPEYFAFTKDGKTLASLDRGGVLRLWGLTAGDALLQLEPKVSGVIVFSPDGRTLASGGNNGEGGSAPRVNVGQTNEPIRLWDVSTGNELARLGDGNDPVCAVAFSADGRFLASAHGVLGGRRAGTAPEGPSNTVRVWEISSGKQVACLKGHTSAACSVAFSPDGSTIASASLDGTVRVWETSSGKEIAVLKGHGVEADGSLEYTEVYSADFSDDGELLVSGGRDGTAIVWDVKAILKMAKQP